MKEVRKCKHHTANGYYVELCGRSENCRKARYRLQFKDAPENGSNRAFLLYKGFNIGPGFKKRLTRVIDGKVYQLEQYTGI